MTQHPANFAEQQRRAVRRTAWITAAVALAILLAFFLKQGFWH